MKYCHGIVIFQGLICFDLSILVSMPLILYVLLRVVCCFCSYMYHFMLSNVGFGGSC